VNINVIRSIVAAIALAVCAMPGLVASARARQGTINVPPEEAKAYQPIEAAATADEAMVAAKAFMAKYPQSAAIPQVEIAVYNKIIEMPKDEKRLASTATFKQMFPSSTRIVDLERGMAEYYIAKNDTAELKRTSEAYLAAHPDDVTTHYLLLRIAVDGLKRNDTSMLESGRTHGKRAIELLESATPPADFGDASAWQAYKNENLGLAYQSYGIIGLATGDTQMATEYLTKATTASPADPLNFLFLASLKETVYTDLAKKFNAMPDRKSAEAKKALDDANAVVGEMIRRYATASVLSENKPEYAQVYANAKEALEEHYKYRHDGKLDGLDAVLKTARGGQ
jgi:hypothetical protein